MRCGLVTPENIGEFVSYEKHEDLEKYILDYFGHYSGGVRAFKIDEVEIHEDDPEHRTLIRGASIYSYRFEEEKCKYFHCTEVDKGFLEINKPHAGGYLCYTRIRKSGEFFCLPAEIFESLFTPEDKP